jgi:hypothetical protein
MREDAPESLVVEIMRVGAGTGVEAYGSVWLTMRAMEGGVAGAVVVVAFCLRLRA